MGINWLLIFIPIAVVLEHAWPQAHTWILFAACVAIIPIARLIVEATEHIASRTGDAVGNAPELIIATVALKAGLFDMVRASLIGAILANLLLVQGVAFLLGELRYHTQEYNSAATRVYSSMMLIAVISLVVPSSFRLLFVGAPWRDIAMSSSTKILVGLVSGVIVGLVLGEYAGYLKVAADGYVKLLQMTVLPYITISIITSLGALSYAQVKTLEVRAGAVLMGLWSIALVFFFIPLAFPETETASYFSTTLVQRRPPFNFVDLFIPSNPFYSLANNIVPAVVLFSVFLGVALVGVERKLALLDVFAVAQDALSRATKFVVGLTPATRSTTTGFWGSKPASANRAGRSSATCCIGSIRMRSRRVEGRVTSNE